MNGYWMDLVLIAVLIVLNALFAGSEIALISLRESQLRRLRRGAGASAIRLVRLVQEPNRFLATVQIGITLAGFLASATAAVSLAEPLVPVLDFAGQAARPLAIALVTLTLTFVILVVGELAPKRLAMQYAERWPCWRLPPRHPRDHLPSRRVDTQPGHGPDHPPIRWQPARSPAASQSRRAARHGHQPSRPDRRTAHHHLQRPGNPRALLARRPRPAPRGIHPARRNAAAQARLALARSGHSRAPVLRAGHLDEVLGIVHLRDLTTAEDTASVTEVARPASFLPDFITVSDALRRLMATHQQFALVVDEYGSAEGIVTIDDLLEEIVGEIYDETDPDTLTVQPQADGSLLLPGTFPVRDLSGLGVDLGDLADGPYTTIAGLALAQLGHMPQCPGESIQLPGAL